MSKLSMMVGLFASLGGVAVAEPGGAFGSSEYVAVLPSASCDPTVLRGTMRIKAGPGTHSEGSAPIAAATGASVPVIPVITRNGNQSDLKQRLLEPAWTVDLEANLGPKAVPGNLIVTVYDGDDAHALAHSEVMALHQVHISHDGCVSLRVDLSPDEGARANHNYRIQLVQLLGNRKVLLADGMVALK